MLTYELCKKLEEAGFKVNRDRMDYFVSYYKNENGEQYNGPIREVYNWDSSISRVIIPTLSELIHTCGDGFMGIRRYKDKLFCAVRSDGHIMEDYPTPEEAVASLWLDLKK